MAFGTCHRSQSLKHYYPALFWLSSASKSRKSHSCTGADKRTGSISAVRTPGREPRRSFRSSRPAAGYRCLCGSIWQPSFPALPISVFANYRTSHPPPGRPATANYRRKNERLSPFNPVAEATGFCKVVQIPAQTFLMAHVTVLLTGKANRRYLNIKLCVGKNSGSLSDSSAPRKPWSKVAYRRPLAAVAIPTASATVIPPVCMVHTCTSPIERTAGAVRYTFHRSMPRPLDRHSKHGPRSGRLGVRWPG